jgi:hypothetical protein
VHAVVRLNGRRLRTLRGRAARRTRIRLRRVPRGRFTIRIAVRYADGARRRFVRRYRACPR